ncbi:MAG: hypothetical protein ACLUOI_16890 [Eisenbergiella sp.]
MKSVKWTLGSLALFFLCLLFFPGRVSAEDTPVAAEGVYIEDVNVSGMTEEEISQAVSEKMARLQQDTIVFYVNDRSVSVTAGAGAWLFQSGGNTAGAVCRTAGECTAEVP